VARPQPIEPEEPEAREPAAPDRASPDRHPTGVPRWLDRGAAIGWRLLVIGAVVLALAIALSRVLVVIVPIVVALFLSTILVPAARFLRRHRWPPLAATWAVFLAGLVIIGGIVAWLVPTISGELSRVGDSASRGSDQVQHWLVHGPFHLSRKDVHHDYNNALDQVKSHAGGFAARGATIAGEVATGLLLSLVLTFFFVKDGDRIARGFLRLAPPNRREEVRTVGRRAWSTLGGYIRGTTINGIVNGGLMTLGLFIIGVPLAAPLGILTFFGAYFPIVGAIVTGALAALVALVAKGPIAALIVIALTIVIHNVEGYLVGPFVLGRAVKLHPVAVLLALAIGGVLAGIIGAFLAVPVTAVAASVFEYYRPPDERETSPPPAVAG
jgi:putative heme transporter